MGHSFVTRAVRFYSDAARVIRIKVMTQTLRLGITLYKFKIYRAKRHEETSSLYDLRLWRQDGAKEGRGVPPMGAAGSAYG